MTVKNDTGGMWPWFVLRYCTGICLVGEKDNMGNL